MEKHLSPFPDIIVLLATGALPTHKRMQRCTEQETVNAVDRVSLWGGPP
jgi:hypothetical protein